MKRSKKLCFGLLLVFSIMFGLSLNVSLDVSALDDLRFSYNLSNPVPSGNYTVCNGDCPAYRFLSVIGSGLSSGTSNLSFYFTGLNSSPYATLFRDNLPSVIAIPSGVTRIVFDLRLYDQGSNDYSISIIFSENNPYGSAPSGSLSITENGIYDVSSYAEAVVNVENDVIQGDYHDDLVSINNSILIVAAVGLVIYFFYAIYRMILGGRR